MPDPQSPTFANGKHAIDKYAGSSAAGKRAAVVLLHGVDGLGVDSGPQIRKFAEQIAAAGYLVYVPHYFDAADGADTLPITQLFDLRVPRLANYPARIAAAVDYVRREPDVDAARLGLIGFSLGGGLALGYAESAPAGQVKALVDFFGYLGDPGIVANVSRLPPTLVLHSRDDEVVKIVYSSGPLVAALKNTAVAHEHEYFPDKNPDKKNHPFLPGGPADIDSRARAIAWLKKYIKP